MGMKEIAVEQALRFIEPGPVVLVSTNDGNRDNVMTISWTMAMDFNQHIAISTGRWNHSFDTMMKTRECVVAIPPVDMIETVVKIGTVNGDKVDKFKEFGLTAAAAKSVKAPLVGECIANLECQVTDYVEKHGLVILQVKHVWYNTKCREQRMFHANGDGTFVTDGETFNYRHLMEKWVPKGL